MIEFSDYTEDNVFRRDSNLDLSTEPKNLIAVIELPGGRIDYISEDLLQFTGSGNKRDLRWISDILPEWRSYLKKVEESGKDRKAKLQDKVIASGNSERYVEIDALKVSRPDAEHLVVILKDVTEYHLQNRVLEEVFFSSPYAVTLINKDARIIGLNNHFMKLFRYSSEEILNQPVKLLAPKGLSDQMDKNIRESCSGRIVKSSGLRITKDRRLINVEILCYPIVHDNYVERTFILYLEKSEGRSRQAT